MNIVASCFLSLILTLTNLGAPLLELGSNSLESNDETSVLQLSTSLLSETVESKVLQIDVSVGSSCLRNESLEVWCWGGWGNSFDFGFFPVQIAGMNSVIDIAVGRGFACGVLVDGSVECFGSNGYGQLGNLTREASTAPVQVFGIENAVDISAGEFHACATLISGRVKCWGANWSGQLGIGTLSDYSSSPVVVLNILTAYQVEASAGFTCALIAQGDVYCWGIDVSSSEDHPKPTPFKVSELPNSIVTIRSANSQVCAITSESEVYCWGYLGSQFGDGPYPQVQGVSSPQPVTVFSGAINLVLGENHACIVKVDQSVLCAGYNGYGQLGAGFSGWNTSKLLAVNGLEGLSQLTGDENHNCAITSEGYEVKCWGANWNGRIGDGTKKDRYSPTKVKLNARGAMIKDAFVEDSGRTGCALLDSGYIKCWGAGDYGMNGDGTTLSRSTPVLVRNIDNAIQISGGGYSRCALLASKRIKCWGYNYGSEDMNDFASIPVLVPDIDDAVEVQHYYSTTCARLETGRVKCWGANESGQLGNGSLQSSATPVEVSDVTNAIRLLEDRPGVILESGDVAIWGWGAGLENFDTGAFPTPTVIPGVHDVKQMSSWGNTCYVTNGGEVYCWGDGPRGLNGDGTFETRTTPVQVVGISNALEVHLINDLACALLTNGSVKCWGGAYWNGQQNSPLLGDGTNLVSNVPVEVVGVSDAKELSLGQFNGSSHACALLQNGKAKCWGFGFHYSLGTGTREESSVPVFAKTNAVFSRLISSMSGHQCGFLASGGMECWGGVYGYNAPCAALDDRYLPCAVPSLFTPSSPDAPRLYVDFTNYENIGLSWAEPFDGDTDILEYLVEYRRSGDSDWTRYGSNTGADKDVVIPGLDAFEEYEFRVAAVNEIGLSWSDSLVALTGTFGPDAPEPRVDFVTSSTVKLSWDVPFDGYSPINKYLVQVEKEFGDYSTFYLTVDPSSSPSVEISGLTPYKRYRIFVAAVNANASTYSEEIEVTTSGFLIDNIPTQQVWRASAIEITGVGLEVVDTIKLNGDSVLFQIISDSLIVATIPLSGTTGPLQLFDDDFSLQPGYLLVSTQIAAPSISIIEPYVSIPGAKITVRGANLGSATSVQLASQPTDFEILSKDSLKFTIPSNAINGRVTISTIGGSATSRQRILIPPRITTTELLGGIGGTVSLSGENLQDANFVIIDGEAITPQIKQSTRLVFQIPQDIDSSFGYALGPGGISNYFEFELLSPPTLNNFTLSSKIGDTITLTGTNLMNITGVKVGTIAASSFSSTDTTVTFVVPTGATSNKVTFSGAAGTVTSASTLTVAQPPKITSISPKSGKVGSTVTINGTNLSNATVTFGTKVATKSSNTATRIKVKVPTGLAKGVVTIKVVTTNGEATISFTVT